MESPTLITRLEEDDVALDMDELGLGIEFEKEYGLDSDRDEDEDDFWSKLHGPKCNDDEVKLNFFEKKSYTLFYSELKYKTKLYIQF